MNKFLFTLLFLSLSFAVKAGFPEGKDGFNIKKIEDSYRLPCNEIGKDNCIARSIGISACTFILDFTFILLQGETDRRREVYF